MSTKVTAQMVKELRERTGVGMTKCKEALDQSGGDMDGAIDFLRKSGMAQAVKKEGRETKEGAIAVGEDASTLALLEVNTETDFVAQNENFKEFINALAEEAAKTKPADLDAFMAQSYSGDPALTIEEYRASIVQKLGENIRIKRLQLLPKSSDVSYGVYSHMGGKIVAVVELTGASGQEELARGISMHIAAESPEYLSSDEIPADVKAKEEEIARSQIKNKPAEIVDKIIQGKLKAFYDQVCLLNQKYVRDPDVTIEKLVENEGKSLGKPLKLKSFIRWNIGE